MKRKHPDELYVDYYEAIKTLDEMILESYQLIDNNRFMVDSKEEPEIKDKLYKEFTEWYNRTFDKIDRISLEISLRIQNLTPKAGISYNRNGIVFDLQLSECRDRVLHTVEQIIETKKELYLRICNDTNERLVKASNRLAFVNILIAIVAVIIAILLGYIQIKYK
jgi:hypothetical protein